MAWPKGKKRPKGAGRQKGSPNKVTVDARNAIAQFVDGNSPRLQEWLDRVANGMKDADDKYIVTPNPEKAFNMFQSVIEYHVPKLSRAEHTGEDGGSIKHDHCIEVGFVGKNKS